MQFLRDFPCPFTSELASFLKRNRGDIKCFYQVCSEGSIIVIVIYQTSGRFFNVIFDAGN